MNENDYYSAAEISKGLNVAASTACIYLCRPEFSAFRLENKNGYKTRCKYRWCRDLIVAFNKIYDRERSRW